MDLISRQAVIEAVDSIIERDKSGSNDVVNALFAWKEYLKAVPSVESVVRCKDCKYRPYLREGCDSSRSIGFNLVFPYEFMCPCDCDDPYYSYIPDDDWFCADGEMKESD